MIEHILVVNWGPSGLSHGGSQRRSCPALTVLLIESPIGYAALRQHRACMTVGFDHENQTYYGPSRASPRLGRSGAPYCEAD